MTSTKAYNFNNTVASPESWLYDKVFRCHVLLMGESVKSPGVFTTNNIKKSNNYYII